MAETTLPAPSLHGKTPAPPKLDATTRAAVVMGNWICHDTTGIPQPTLVEVFAAAIRDAEAAARVAAIEEAARAVDKHADGIRAKNGHNQDCAESCLAQATYCAGIVRSPASSPAPAKRAETEEAEKCESGCEAPVTCHDIDGVPLCAECGADLQEEAEAEKAANPPKETP